MRINANWMDTCPTRKIMSILEDHGAQAYFVGGCVRDTLLQKPVNDVDIATNFTPEDIIDIAKTAKIRAIPTGIEHGTVTLVLEGQAYEITTFRKDIETDGRRAKVIFSQNIHDDAQRRDFTMNALYLDKEGSLIDPLQGLRDVRKKRVRFIGHAKDRIREDYLRIIRFYRFHAWYGDQHKGFDSDALNAIAKNLDGLADLSKERIGLELLKLLNAPDPSQAVASMQNTGVLNMILEGADSRLLPLLAHFEIQSKEKPDPIRRLAALGGQDAQKQLRLSKKQAQILSLLRNEMGCNTDAAELSYRYGANFALSVILLRSAQFEMPPRAEDMQKITKAAMAVFPVRAMDLDPRYEGKQIGEQLRSLEEAWINSGFSFTKDDLLK